MKSRLWVYSGVRPSNGAKALAAQPGFLRLRPGNFHKVKEADTIINWGTTASVEFPINILNMTSRVKSATDKLQAFKLMDAEGVSVVNWAADQATAQAWSDDGQTVVVRNKLTGHSGDGIVIIEKGGQVPPAPLYTRYIFKEREFRVHVVSGVAIDTQQKIKDPEREVITWKVRSHENGFIFARNGIAPNDARDLLAVGAVSALGLDFGAVDIIEDKKGNFYVLEVNTAPGLEGQTVNSYTEAFSGAQG